jgi:hypothetical protein
MSSSTSHHGDRTRTDRESGGAEEDRVTIGGGSIVSDMAASEFIDEVTSAVDAAIGEQPVETTPDETTGFEFVTQPEHHDPVVRATKAYERGDLSVGPLSSADLDRLKSFVARAEAGAFNVRDSPKVEAAVRIARLLVYEQYRE